MDQAPPPAQNISITQRITNFWNSGTRGKVTIIGTALIVCCCCSIIPLSRYGNANAPAASPTTLQPIVTATLTIEPTQAPPTNSPTPENTATSVPSPTPEPEPITLTGTGDSVVDVAKTSNYPAILKAKYSSGGNFAILNYGPNNERIDLLVNTIGAYEGTVPLDFRTSEHTVRLEITASGPWEIQILPVSQARHATIPGTIQGIGDDVIYLDGSNPDTIKADASQGSGNFAVFSYSDSGIDLVFNEIAPYTGTALLNNTTFLISVTAEGNWSLEITTR